jgi:hypothetical protein
VLRVQRNKVRTGLWWDNLLTFSHFFKLGAVAGSSVESVERHLNDNLKKTASENVE